MLNLCQLIRHSWLAAGVCRYNSERELPKDHSIKVWSQLAQQFQRRRFLNIFLIKSYVKLMSVDSAVLVGSGVCIYSSERGPLKDHSIKVWYILAYQFQRRRFLNIFPIRSYVQTMSVDSAVLVGGRGVRIKF